MSPEVVEKPRTFFETVKLLAEISIVLGAGFFFIGWTYLYGYYRIFGLHMTELDFTSQTLLIYSWPVIKSVTFGLVFFSALAILGTIHWLAPNLARFLSQPISVIAFVVATCAFLSWLAISIGMENAKRDAFLSTSSLPHVKFEGTVDTQATGCRLDDWNYLLLLRAKGQVYVFNPIDDTSAIVAPNLRVCVFPESRIQATRIQVGLDGT